MSRLPAGSLARDGRTVWRELAFGTGEHLDAALLARVRGPVRVVHGDRSPTAFAAAARRVVALGGLSELLAG